MINYTLKCDNGHQFDSWFQSAEAFDKLCAAGMVSCAVCGSAAVKKAIMAPRLNQSAKEVAKPLSQPASPAEQAMAEIRKKVEENSDYVGKDFAKEARAIHDGTAPERSIYGEARLEDAKKLVEDGVPVAPLPFNPTRKTN